ncbi:MAG: IS3 family transposase [Caldilineaceae bacterium]|nr:IS3 family transposase [Caldilineaceae bacterium]
MGPRPSAARAPCTGERGGSGGQGIENGSKKNFRTQVINHAHTANQPAEQRYTLTELCGYFGISRQAHYQLQWRQAQRTAEAETIVAAVQTIRHRHRRMGTRKLWKELPNTLAEQGIHIGRDRLFALLRQRNLLVPRVRRPHRTTWAGLWRCDNLLAAKVVTAPNQAWVSDITYILTDVGFRYLVLITDVFSRRIMGFDLSDSLTVDGLTRALDMALAQVPGRPNGLIFHSDHGTQYTCHAFRQQLAHHHIRSSMGEVGNAYDNALAERINGILKLEYGLDGCFLSHQQALRAIRQAVYLYNVERPHLALNYQKPEQLYHHYIRFSLN